MRIAESLGIEAIEINKLQYISKTVSCMDTLNDRDMAPLPQKKSTLKAVSISIQVIDKKIYYSRAGC
jgi:hypothetical protein